jgi:hypothetical protein
VFDPRRVTTHVGYISSGQVTQAGLEITDDRAERARAEQARGAEQGGALDDGRQLSQGGFDSQGHVAKLPAGLLGDSARLVWGGQPSRLSGIGSGTQGVSCHMGSAPSLPGGSSGGYGCRNGDLTSGSVSPEGKAAGRPDAKLATGEGS